MQVNISWRQQMEQVITIQGKAKNVFKYTALLAKRQGNTKIKDIKQHNQSLP
jgi:hypothetical protein